MIPSFSQAVGCPARGAYSYKKMPATSRANALGGRARYRLKDAFASYSVDITMEMDESQFSRWKTFWVESINNGADWFRMSLMMDLPEIYNTGQEEYTVHALGQWSAALSAHGLWTVGLSIEVPGGTIYPVNVCDVVFGGPIDDLKEDVIWAGDITNLPEDVIVPCAYVQP